MKNTFKELLKKGKTDKTTKKLDAICCKIASKLISMCENLEILPRNYIVIKNTEELSYDLVKMRNQKTILNTKDYKYVNPSHIKFSVMGYINKTTCKGHIEFIKDILEGFLLEAIAFLDSKRNKKPGIYQLHKSL